MLRAGQSVEFVFSDINMPGMDGVALAKWVRQEYPDMPIILTSGVTTADARNGFFLPKPYTFDTLVAHLKRFPGV